MQQSQKPVNEANISQRRVQLAAKRKSVVTEELPVATARSVPPNVTILPPGSEYIIKDQLMYDRPNKNLLALSLQRQATTPLGGQLSLIDSQISNRTDRNSREDYLPCLRDLSVENERISDEGNLGSAFLSLPLPSFCGPSSSSFGFSMAEFILQHLMEDAVYTDNDGRSASAKIQVSSDDRSCLNSEQEVQPPTNFDLCQTMELEEALRLLGVYHEVFGVLHPFLDMATLRRQASILWGALQPVPSSQSTAYPPSQDNHVVKLAIAIALLCESGGYHPTATAIYQSMQVLVVQSVLGFSFDLGRLVLLVLIGVYHWYQGDYRLSSRFLAVAVRLIFENHQMSFAAGLPTTFRDANIEIPDVSGSSYLRAMTSYVDFGSRHWNSVVDNHGEIKAAFDDEAFDRLDDEVNRWPKTFCSDLQPQNLEARLLQFVSGEVPDKARGPLIASTILYLRANQIRILVMRPILFSLRSILNHSHRVADLIEIAQDTIHKLVQLDRCSDLYRKHQVILNHFLSSATSVFFLALAQSCRLEKQGIDHTASTSLSPTSLKETLFRAFDLIRSYSSMSPASQRLWDSFSVPRSLLITYGLLKRPSSYDGENSLFDDIHSSNSSHISMDPDVAGEACDADGDSGLQSELPTANSTTDDVISASQEEFCISDFLIDSRYGASLNIDGGLFYSEDNQEDLLNNMFQ
ncbi:hypothetical protein THAR02_02956 [Trichoderma harzianum]|uniref:Transcription factor domain-containing protein n=1 Tax=Trichoderma harzianum TaxID=5544 RepID=A0A0F9XKC7_TRIHA|nr:hypothetical protein THAR02_02956 [Trichoderma harzianum]